MLPFTAVMAQSNGKGSAEGTLAVTATVVASTSMIIEADGQPRLIIVNATDFRDNFVSAVIDETGKLQSLRTIRQDARSQPAIRALQQWQFLPAQLDGQPVASKVLIGVIVRAEEQEGR